MIHRIRSAKTAEDEESIITTELASTRTDIRDCNPEFLPRIITKLVYLNMIGRSTTFGQLYCINLMSDERFSFKRIGYLGASMLFDENTEISVLFTHTLEKDLQSKNRYVISLALGLIANLGSTEICRSLSTEVHKILEFSDPFLKKRAAMAVIRIIKKLPESTETFQPHVHLLLNDTSHSVVLSGIGIVIEMLRAQPHLSQNWARFTTAFVKILRSLNVSSRSASEPSDPFLQIKVLEILQLLRSPSDELDEVLASIVSSADMRRSDSRAVLLQAVQTIVCVGKQPSLRTLAFNQIGKLLNSQDPNMLYSALNVFSRVLYANRDILDRTGSDALALQRHKGQIVRCLDNPDVSIRRRALDVISALIDVNNAERLVPEIIKYLHYADSEFRVELVSRVFIAIQRFSPNEKWNFDMILQILKESGGYVKSDIISSVCKIISRSKSMQTYAVSKLLPIIQESSTVQSLVQVGSWILGEYGEYNEEVEKTFLQILKLPQTSKETKSYILTALAKLSTRSPNGSNNNQQVIEALKKGSRNNDLDIQQRSGEYLRIISQTNNAENLLAPVPPYEEELNEDGQPQIQQNQTQQNNNKLIDIDNWMSNDNVTNNSNSQQNNSNNSNNLIDDLLGDLISNNNSNNSNSNDLLLIAANQQQNNGNNGNNAQKQMKINVPPDAHEIFNKDLRIFLEVKWTPGNNNMAAIRISIFNTSEMTITNMAIQYAATDGWISQSQPPSGNALQPLSQMPISQITYWKNNGSKTTSGLQYRPLAMSIRVSYVYGAMPCVETIQVPQKVFE
ncbi:Adaptin N terminal region family protein [Histomonas meleagridis]|uniref:Adaptin N terminal region family protein n=1 Tax=Histomonas meleagridis TaxID=135588 RepID=UPI003559DD63|nr:Adaptin N terminal region family protein [Histomonas meleagridis]KAH0805079.1 Adaptin N terminal region family protein [Histomonas meleagridis]